MGEVESRLPWGKATMLIGAVMGSRVVWKKELLPEDNHSPWRWHAYTALQPELKSHPHTLHQPSKLSSMRSTLLEASTSPLIYWTEKERRLEEEPLKLPLENQCPSLLQELEMDSLLELSTAGQPLTKLETRVDTTFSLTDAMLMEPSRSMVAKSHSQLSPI